MDTYIFFSPNISNLGGAEVYMYNKANWLSKNGYEVIIISTKKGEILIKDFEKHRKRIIGDLSLPPHFYNKTRRQLIINKTINVIGPIEGKVIIESNALSISAWGEIIAKHLNSKHIVFSLQEINSTRIEDLKSFIHYKFKRKELAGIKQESFKRIFENKWNETNVLVAYLSNTPKHVNCKLVEEIKPADYTIGSISRLDKPFVIPMFKDLIKYIQINNQYSYNLLFIGGTDDNLQINRIKKIAMEADNLNLYITGFIFPIPISLIMIPDLFISSSGSCRISAMHKKLTISIDTNDYKPIGLFGINTDNSFHRVGEEKVELDVLLNEILMENLYKSSDFNYDVKPTAPNYMDHINFINNSNKSEEYYEFDYKKSVNIFTKLALSVFGANIVKIAVYIKKRINF